MTNDQVYIAAMVLEWEAPGTFAGDPGMRMVDFYPHSFLGLISALKSLTGGMESALFALSALCIIVFACGMYVLVRQYVRQVEVVLVIMFAALWYRAGFSGSPWDVSGGLARSMVLAAAPWLVLLYRQWMGEWKLIFVFGALGILANYHPLCAGGFAVILGLATLSVNRGRKTYAILAAAMMIFIFASSPWLWQFVRATGMNGERPEISQIDQVWKERMPPHIPHWRTVRWVGFHVCLIIIPAAIGLWHRGRVYRFAMSLIPATLFLSILFPRLFHFIYLPLFIFAGIGIEYAGNKVINSDAMRGVLLYLMIVCVIVPASCFVGGIQCLMGKMEDDGRLPDKFYAAAWLAQVSTEDGAVFAVEPRLAHYWRWYARRPVVADWKSVSLVRFDPAAGVAQWKRCQEVEKGKSLEANYRLKDDYTWERLKP